VQNSHTLTVPVICIYRQAAFYKNFTGSQFIMNHI